MRKNRPNQKSPGSQKIQGSTSTKMCQIEYRWQHRNSSLIQTILSVPESHRIGHPAGGSRTLPPVGNHTLPRRLLCSLPNYYNWSELIIQVFFQSRVFLGQQLCNSSDAPGTCYMVFSVHRECSRRYALEKVFSGLRVSDALGTVHK